MDLLNILPDFNTKPYSHILPPLERRHITTVDLISLDYLEIAKRAHVPPADVRRLCADVVGALHLDLNLPTSSTGEIVPKQVVALNAAESDVTKCLDDHNDDNNETRGRKEGGKCLDLLKWNSISTLDPVLDELLGGGIPTGYLTEVTGESGSGKTQFLLNLLLATQLPSPKGAGRKAIYISTEAPLSTPRLSQILQSHPYLANLPAEERPSLANVLSITAIDLETQDHILNYQLPVAISRYNAGLVVIDSIAANYRAEHTSHSMQGLSARSGELARLGHMLRNLAVKHDVAIVVANQVSDRFDSIFVDAQQPPRLHGRYTPATQQQQPQHQADQTPSRSRHPATWNNNKHMTSELSSSPGFPSSMPSSSPSPSQLPPEDDAFDGAYIVGHPVRNEALTLSHQQRFFTGWGDHDIHSDLQSESQKTPALGFVWSTQIACRIALKKEDEVVDLSLARAEPARHGKVTDGEVRSTENHVNEEGSTHAAAASSPSTPSRRQTKSDTVAANADVAAAAGLQTLAKSVNHTQAERITTRRVKLVFAPWTSGLVSNNKNELIDEVEFQIWRGGIRSTVSSSG